MDLPRRDFSICGVRKPPSPPSRNTCKCRQTLSWIALGVSSILATPSHPSLQHCPCTVVAASSRATCLSDVTFRNVGVRSGFARHLPCCTRRNQFWFPTSRRRSFARVEYIPNQEIMLRVSLVQLSTNPMPESESPSVLQRYPAYSQAVDAI